MEVDVANAGLLPRGDYEKVLERIIQNGHCPFCEENLPKVHPNPILWTSAHWVVTTNAWPYAGVKSHFLLISRTHVTRIEDLSIGARLSFFDEFDQLSSQFNFKGASILWRSGDTEYTGASVMHLHAQIVVGYPRSPEAPAITGLLGFGPPSEKSPSS